MRPAMFGRVCVAVLAALSVPTSVQAQKHELVYARDGSGVFGYKDTPVQPWSKFHVHDPDRPAPPRDHAAGAVPGPSSVPAVRRRGLVQRPGPLRLAADQMADRRRLPDRDRRPDGYQAGVRRLSAACRVAGAGGTGREHLGPGQQRRVPAGQHRGPDLRLVRHQDLPRRPGGGDLCPDPAAGQRLPQAGRVADLRHRCSRRPSSRTRANWPPRRGSRCCTTACWCT